MVVSKTVLVFVSIKLEYKLRECGFSNFFSFGFLSASVTSGTREGGEEKHPYAHNGQAPEMA